MADVERITAATPAAFRDWLADNHTRVDSVWLIYYKKDSGRPSITWPEAVDEALCVGWIDSKVRSLDDERYEQYFSRRKPTSSWSPINKDRVARLTAEGRMQPAGLEAVAVAKANGSWSILDEVESLVVPDDLAAALAETGTRAFFDELTPSMRRGLLEWLVLAKRDDTRARRVAKITAAAAEGRRPPGF